MASDPRVTGGVFYSQDVELEGMMYARILRSPHPHAHVLEVDASAVPEEVVVLAPDDVGDLGGYGCLIKDQEVLAGERVRHVGDPVAAVAAATPEEAEEALALIEVSYEGVPAVFDAEEAAREEAPLVHERHMLSDNDAAYFGLRPRQGTNVCHRFRIRHGDTESGFSEADMVVEETYRTAGAQHAPMEPHATTAWWEADRLEVWTGSQTPFNTRMDLAGLFGLPEEKVRIVCPQMGGSFGSKTFSRLEPIAACLSRKAGRPVQVVLPREEEWVTLNRHPATIRVRIGAKHDGTLVAKQVECWVDTGAYADCGPGVAQKMGFASPGPYRIPHVRVDAYCCYTNLPPNGAFRGYGQMQSTWASERAMDLLADELGMDPLELRMKNVLCEGDRYCTGEVMHDVHFAELLQSAADAVGWSEGREGKGLCVMLKGMQTPSRASIAVERTGEGIYRVLCATTEMGQGAGRAIRLMAAELLQTQPHNIEIPDPDTDSSPYDTRTTSSRSTHMMGRALRLAVEDLKEDGQRGFGEVVDEGGLDPDSGQGIASSHWHQGAAAAEVGVDEETGRFEVLRLHTPVYAGRVVNRPGAELQNEGSMIMGLGTALFEEISFAEGQVTNANLSDYNIPAADDMPENMTYELVEKEGAEVHGLGETALPPVPPAIGNALHSLGIGVTQLPISPEGVLEAIDARGLAVAKGERPTASTGASPGAKDGLATTGPANGVADRRLLQLARYSAAWAGLAAGVATAVVALRWWRRSLR